MKLDFLCSYNLYIVYVCSTYRSARNLCGYKKNAISEIFVAMRILIMRISLESR